MYSKLVFTLVALIITSYASPNISTRIVGGSTTIINNYPYMSSLIYAPNSVTYTQFCAGSILTTTSILTAAQCFYGKNLNQWKARIGSSYANSGGTIYGIRIVYIHPSFNTNTLDNDVAVLRTSTNIVYSQIVAPAAIAGSSYVLGDNQVVWALGWGYTSINGPSSELLRHVQIWSINQSTCRARYAEIGISVTDNMLCSGWLDVGGRDQCTGDSGGPLLHNNVIVGICSWGQQCALSRFPGVNTRVSRFTGWIQTVAS